MNIILPNELKSYCFGFLNNSELLVCSEVCLSWSMMANEVLFKSAETTQATNKILQKVVTLNKTFSFFDGKDPELNKLRDLFTASTKKEFNVTTLFPSDFTSWDKVIDLVSERVEKVDFGPCATFNSEQFRKRYCQMLCSAS